MLIDLLGKVTVAKEGGLEVTTVKNIAPPTYGQFYKLLVGALDGENSVPVKPEEARDLIRLIEVARESSESGVTVTIKPNEFLTSLG